MGRFSVLVLLIVAAAACGGAQIPTHNGYKGGSKAAPWKKAKSLKFDEKSEAKVEGELSYPDKRRAAWYVARILAGAAPGELPFELYTNLTLTVNRSTLTHLGLTLPQHLALHVTEWVS